MYSVLLFCDAALIPNDNTNFTDQHQSPPVDFPKKNFTVWLRSKRVII